MAASMELAALRLWVWESHVQGRVAIVGSFFAVEK